MVKMLPAAGVPTREVELGCARQFLMAQKHGPKTERGRFGDEVLGPLPVIEPQMQHEWLPILDRERLPRRKKRHRRLESPVAGGGLQRPRRRGAATGSTF